MRFRFHGEVVQLAARRGDMLCLMFSDGAAQWVHKDEVYPTTVVRRMREEV
jgi:hypothetical protein